MIFSQSLREGYGKVLQITARLRQHHGYLKSSHYVKITSRFSQGFINPKCVFWGHKNMTRARSLPDFAQSFDTPLPSALVEFDFRFMGRKW